MNSAFTAVGFATLEYENLNTCARVSKYLSTVKTCTTCGNEIGDRIYTCPFCEHQQTGAPPEPVRQSAIPTINLKQNMPTVAGALAKLKRELNEAKAERRKLVRLVHGYGSTGVGGEIRVAVRRQLQSMLSAKKITSFLPGDDYSERTNSGGALISRHYVLRSTLKADQNNPGITFVEL